MLPTIGLLKHANAVVLGNDEAHKDENIFYLLESAPTDDSLFLIIKRNSKPVLLVSPLEIGNYANRKDVAVKELGKEALERELGKIGGKIGLNFERQSMGQARRLKSYTKARQIDVSEYFGMARKTKTQKEIKKIKAACKITAESLDKAEVFFRKCRTEKQLALRLELEARNNGASGVAFPTIVASGGGSAIPHYITSDKKISGGFLIIDFGVVYDGYCSDVTRTFFVGRPSGRHKRVFSAVWDAKRAATEQCYAGNQAKKVHASAESVIKKAFGRGLAHSVGHGLGIRVHDFPQSVNLKSEFKLKENMCITIEPGCYKAGFGGVRIEDDVVVRKGKCRELTRAGEELISLKA